MKSFRFISLCARVLGILLFAGARTASAQNTPQFFFYSPGQTPTSDSQGLTSLPVTANGDFTLSVWYQFTPAVPTTYYGIDAFIGFDQTNQEGASAAPQNNTIGFGNGLDATTAVTNVNSLLFDLSNQVGGGHDPASSATPSSALRPYGDDIDLASSGVAGFAAPGATPVHLFDITLNDEGLLPGGSQQVVIYSSDSTGDASDFTTYLDNGSNDPGTFDRPASSYTLNAIQSGSGAAMSEPDSVSLSGVAAAVFCCVIRRQRRRSPLVSRLRRL